MRHPAWIAALSALEAGLAAALGALPPPLGRALCALGYGHVYTWHYARRTGHHLECAMCAHVPALGAPIEPARPGCAGCADCTCRSTPWPMHGPRAW